MNFYDFENVKILDDETHLVKSLESSLLEFDWVQIHNWGQMTPALRF